ncbi:MAG TPA: alpha/beta hydrolase [Polyangiales bacterium]|nr:alpha/beta hydrolase [Polyangiales bacterium]
MPTFEQNGVSLYYEEYGSGFPLLLLAPGGMRSSIDFWHRTAAFDATRELASEFRVIAMDQRNAGKSVAPVRADDGWHVYTEDQLALLDHLGIQQCHVLGGCIGGAFALALIQAAPTRVRAAVLQQPIGRSPDNRATFYKLFDDWAAEQKAGRHAAVAAAAWESFREHMYGGDFVYSVPRDAVRGLATPLLVLMGNDIYHPSETSREIVQLAANAELVERWKDPDALVGTVAKVRAFLSEHTPR